MSKEIHVLVFPAGEVNSVELHEALCSNFNIRVYGASSVERHGSYVFENYIPNLPMIADEAFLPALNQVIKDHQIDVIFPTHDTVAVYLSEHRSQIDAKIISADCETAKICRDKKETYDLFGDTSFCPAIYAQPDTFPCFIKPRDGQGGQGAKVIRNASEIPTDVDWEDYVISEFLPGTELTVDCLTDSNGQLCAVLPRTRNRMMAGICVSGTTIQATEELLHIAGTINQRLSFLGLWYFQVRQDRSGNYKLMEISTRCAATMCLSRARGVNLPLLSVYAAMGYPLKVLENQYALKMDRTLISRYQLDYDYDTVYIDYDDTIVVRGKVWLPMIRFVYQCRNNGIKVILLSRHTADHDNTLKDDLNRYAISEALFDEIIDVPAHCEKTEYMTCPKAIFIDNAFAEREKVYNKLHIPVFDVDGIEVLADWRC